jgi:hypothetical protein
LTSTIHPGFDCPKVSGPTGLDRRAPGKKDVQDEAQSLVLSHPAEVGNWPPVADADKDRILKDERMFGDFTGSAPRVVRGRKNLHAGALSSPGTAHRKTAEGAITADLGRSSSLDFVHSLLPTIAIERWTTLDSNDLFGFVERQLDLAGRTCERKIERIRIVLAVAVLAGFSDELKQNEAQFGGINLLVPVAS